MLEQFIVGILWIIGPMIGFVLMLGIVFAEGGAAQTNNMELHIVSKGSMLLLVGLIWLGVSSLIGEDDALPVELSNKSYEDTASVQNAKAPSSYKLTETTQSQTKTMTPQGESTLTASIEEASTHTDTTAEKKVTTKEQTTSKVHYSETDYLLWSSYMLIFLLFMWWVFGSSKKSGKGREVVKEKFMATMRLEADETGLRPWNPDWKEEKSKE